MGTPAKRGRKRKSEEVPDKRTSTSARSVARKVFVPLSIEQFRPTAVGTRVLSCGEGEQLGHPNRNTTKKPRAVGTFPSDMAFVQVAAGGVHSLVLTTDGRVFSCGINEKGTVPVQDLEPEGITDTFSEIVFTSDIQRLGKIVQITAGASFSAALTDKGSVIAWGNLRDTQGEVNVHETLTDIQKRPVVVMRHKNKQKWHIVKVAAGENHLAMLSNDGQILTFGEGSMGQLGRSVRTEHIRARYMVDESGASLTLRVLEHKQFVRFVNIWARGFWTMCRAEDGRLFVCGLNNFGQLGVVARKSVGTSDDDDGPKRKSPGQEESNKVALLTCAAAFPADKQWTHMAGVQHVIGRTADGQIYGIGKNTDNALGMDTWEGNHDEEHWRYDTLQHIPLPEGVNVAGVDATLGASIFWTDDGKVFGFGCDTVGQLGLGIKDEDDEKVVSKPRLITSAHLDGFRVLGVSIADNHALFLAAPIDQQQQQQKKQPNGSGEAAAKPS
uniref:Regulator of chromosome condensation n=1 Tax=Globodera rostochiensis TaxID=31243 RepID=A0A914HFK4_GLORO